MTQLSIQFSQPCPCGGRTGHPHNRRSAIHEASKKHQRWLGQCPKSAHGITYVDTLLILDTTITPSQTQTTPKSDATSSSSSPSTSSTAGKAC